MLCSGLATAQVSQKFMIGGAIVHDQMDRQAEQPGVAGNAVSSI